MNPLTHHFTTMAWSSAWANHRLLAAVARLSDEDFAAPRTSYFPSLLATLNHVLTVDWFYVDALERALHRRPVNAEPSRFFTPEHPFSTCPPLREAQRAVDLRLVAVCRGLTDDRLQDPVGVQRRDGVHGETFERLLAHLFQHQVHHRGQAHAMLAGTSVAPPQLDEFFCAGEARLRAAELAELGTTEEEIWDAPRAR